MLTLRRLSKLEKASANLGNLTIALNTDSQSTRTKLRNSVRQLHQDFGVSHCFKQCKCACLATFQIADLQDTHDMQNAIKLSLIRPTESLATPALNP